MLRRREILFAKRAAVAASATGWAAPTTVTSGTSAGTSVTSLAITSVTIPAGKILVVIAVGQDPSVQTISDDAGGTWTSLAMVQPSSGPVVNHRVFICYGCPAYSTSNTITVALSSSKRTNWLCFYVDTPSGTPALDFQDTATWGTGNLSRTTPALAMADEFVFVPVVVQSAASGSQVTFPVGFTQFVGSTGIGSGSSNPRLHVAWMIASATTALTVTTTLSDTSKDNEFATVALKR